MMMPTAVSARSSPDKTAGLGVEFAGQLLDAIALVLDAIVEGVWYSLGGRFTRRVCWREASDIADCVLDILRPGLKYVNAMTEAVHGRVEAGDI